MRSYLRMDETIPTDAPSNQPFSSPTSIPIILRSKRCIGRDMRSQLTPSHIIRPKSTGRMLMLRHGLKRWLVFDSSLRDLQTLPTTRLLVSEHHTSGWEATISSLWWRNRHSSMIQPSLLPWVIHPCGRTPCTSACPTSVMVMDKTARPDLMLCGKWSWMSWTDERIHHLMRSYQDVQWWIPVVTFYRENSFTTF